MPIYNTINNKKILLIILLQLNLVLTAQNLTLVKDINLGVINNSFPSYLTNHNGKIYFRAGNGESHKLYESDGTDAGTFLVGPTENSAGVIWNLISYNGSLIFSYDDGINGSELWISDGTNAGTMMLLDINPGSLGSQPEYFTICNGLLFFQASNPTRTQGLWVSDGTTLGTQMVGNQYSQPFSSIKFLSFNNKIYFSGNTGTGYGMWESDGTDAGTFIVKTGNIGSSGGSYGVIGSKFYFSSGDGTNGYELWESDGTDAGTVLLKDINPGALGSNISNIFTSNNKIYFSAEDGVNGTEIWVSDGTASGTELLKDVFVGISGSNPESLIELNSEMYFFAFNGTASQLYKTDGTAAGTILIQTLDGVGYVQYVYEMNGKIYFPGSSTFGGAGNLYESDGTEAGTFQIAPFITSEVPTYSNFLNYNSELYLPAYFGNQGVELCKYTSIANLVDNSDQKLGLSIYPNPATNEITISNLKQETNYSIKNLEGKIIQSGKTDGKIIVSSLKSGVYFLNIAGKNNKLVIQ
jgi:ELWxxDGT repeat protein